MNVGKYEIPILKVILGSKFKKFKKLGKKTGKSTKHSRDMYLWQRYIHTKDVGLKESIIPYVRWKYTVGNIMENINSGEQRECIWIRERKFQEKYDGRQK